MHAESDGAGLEQRLSNLQSQIDGLRHTGSDDTRLLEQRLPSLAEDSAAILRRWAAIADRHVRAVTQLEAHLRELGDAGNRLQQDATERLQNLERIIEQEWSALREIHEAPARPVTTSLLGVDDQGNPSGEHVSEIQDQPGFADTWFDLKTKSVTSGT